MYQSWLQYTETFVEKLEGKNYMLPIAVDRCSIKMDLRRIW
jgi:hypothetical protein